MLFNIKTEKSKLVLIWAIKELMGSDCLSVKRRGLSLVSARKSFDLLSVLAMGAKEGGQREGIVFNIPNLIQSFTLKTRNVMPTKKHVSYHDSYYFPDSAGTHKAIYNFFDAFFLWDNLLLLTILVTNAVLSSFCFPFWHYHQGTEFNSSSHPNFSASCL